MKTIKQAFLIAVLCAAVIPAYAQNTSQTQKEVPGLPSATTPNQTAVSGETELPSIQPEIAAPSKTLKECTYTVDQALEIAFKNSPDIKIAEDLIKKAAGNVEQQKAYFYPTFTTGGSYTIQPPTTASMGGQSIPIQSAQETAFTGSILLPLDVSSKLRFATDVSKYQFQMQYLNLVTVSQKLIVDVKTAYYNLLRAQGQEDARQAAVNDSAARLKDTQAKFAAGTVPKFDVTRAEVDLANLNQQLIQAENQVALSQATLNKVLGISLTSPTWAAKVDIPISQTPIDVQNSIDAAYKQRPEVKSALIAIDANKKNVKLQKTALLPSFNLETAGTYNVETSVMNSNNFNWQIIMSVSETIWDGGVTKAKVKQAKAEVENAQDTANQVKLGVALDVKSSILNLEEAAKRTNTTAQAVALAEESLRLSTVRYNAGIATLVEVTDAQSALTDARFNYVNALYDYAIYLSDYQKAIANQPELCNVKLIDPRKIVY